MRSWRIVREGGQSTRPVSWVCAVMLLVFVGQGWAQGPPAKKAPVRQVTRESPSALAQANLKGIFEAVNYNQDLKLFDAFFVTGDEGWVSGAAGTILHTTDGGLTWATQLGGDAQGQGPDITRLVFLDKTHGWAQGRTSQLYRTTDGENWVQVNDDVRGQNVVFVTPVHGFYGYGGKIYATRDGGTTWKEVFACEAQALIQGLTQRFTCDAVNLQFASPSVGYGVGTNNGVLGGGVVVKSEDGGASWKVVFLPQESGDQRHNVVFFLDENRGFALRNTGMFRSTDGGASWQGVAATLPRNDVPLKFADLEVGWLAGQLPASGSARLTYTVDGGAHWLARDLHFPAVMNGFSLPRRDRGYVVGEHGMIYRYRVVPASYTAANIIAAPLMPGFDSTVPGEVATLNDIVTKLREKLPAIGMTGGQSSGFQQNVGASSGGAAGTAKSGTVTAGAGSTSAGNFQQNTETGPVAGGYTDSCCGSLIQQLETTASMFATDVPAFSQRFRSLNLILQGLDFLNSIVGQANALKQSIRALRLAKDPQTAATALGTVQSQLNHISSSGGFVQDTTPPQP